MVKPPAKFISKEIDELTNSPVSKAECEARPDKEYWKNADTLEYH
jgi:hypothetical protein